MRVASDSMAAISSAKYGWETSDTARPSDFVPPMTSDRAMASPVYPVSSIAFWTRSRVSPATGLVSLITCDTVVMETPARAATSRMVTMARDLTRLEEALVAAVLCVGLTTLDVTQRVDAFPDPGQKVRSLDAVLSPGGPAANAARAVAALGGRAALLTALGADALGEFVRASLDPVKSPPWPVRRP